MGHIISIAAIDNNQDYLAHNLRRLLDARNISEAELARQTSIPQPTLHKILSGKTNDPRASTVKSLADFFGISIDELMTGVNSKIKSDSKSKIQSVAIISWEDCLHFETQLSNITPSNWSQWIVTEFVSDKTFALISKPSMEPKFPRGSILIVDPSATPEDGDLVIAHYPDTKEATVRELNIDGPIRTFTTIGKPSSSTTPSDNKISIIGVVVKSIFAFD